MKRRIAAVLMADVTGLDRALAEDAAGARARLAACRAVIEGLATRGGGRLLPTAGDAVLADFNSAVEAVRAAVDIQETLRARNKPLAPLQRLEFKLGIAIGELIDQGAAGEEVTAETLASVAHLLSLASPGGLCISRSVREAVASKLKLKFQDLSDGDDTPSTYRVASERQQAAPSPAPVPASLVARMRNPAAYAGLAAAIVLAVYVAIPKEAPKPAVADAPRPGPASVAVSSAPAEQKRPGALMPAPNSGRVEFLPAHSQGGAQSPGGAAPDPARVLTAQRMLPQAWRECHAPAPETAAAGCKMLIDSGIPRGDELAYVQTLLGKALRDTDNLDGALTAFNASIAASPTPAAFGLRGTVQYQKGDLENAIADYSEAIRRDARNGEALNNRAWTYYRTGRNELALADADAAVRLLAKESYVWDTRAHIHARLGNREAAIRDFRAALAIDPRSESSKAGLKGLGVN